MSSGYGLPAWMSGLPPQAIAQAKQAPPDPGEYRLPVGNWKGHRLRDVPAGDLRALLRMPPWAVRDEVKQRIRAVLGPEGL